MSGQDSERNIAGRPSDQERRRKTGTVNRRHPNPPFPRSKLPTNPSAEPTPSQAEHDRRTTVHNWPVRVTPRSWVVNVAIALIAIFAIVLIYAVAQPPADIAHAATVDP